MDENEKNSLAEIARTALAEWQRRRRWSIFFRFAFIGLIVLFISTLASVSQGPGLDIPVAPGAKHVALVKVEGPILHGLQASSDYVTKALEMAFESEHSLGVIVHLNTPGGSPVQSGYIAQAILELREKHRDKPLYVVVSEVCASGGMYIATAANEIYAHPDSIIGSIGVIAGGFGFTGMMEKIGLERRILTAGEHKAMLDPFADENPEEVAHVQSILDEIHRRFIERVKEGRAGKLADDPKLFSGLIWTGHKAKELGLIDGFGDVAGVAKEKFDTTEIHEYKAFPVWFDSFLHRLGAQIGRWVRATHAGLQSSLFWL